MEKENKKIQELKNKILSKNEEVLYDFSLGNRFINISFAITLILGIITIPLVVGIFIILLAIFSRFYQKESNKYFFTNKRIIIMKGWLSTKTTSIDYDKITDVRISEPFFERLFYKTGDLIINTAGSSRDEISLKRIENPYEVKKTLEDIKDGSFEKK